MKRIIVAYESGFLTMDKRCHKTCHRKMHREPDFGKRFDILMHYMEHRTRKEVSK